MFDYKLILELVIILAAVIYVYRLFRGTRGAQVLMGLLLIFGSLILLTKLFQLTLLASVLQASYAFFVLFVMIVFQPEIRRVLAELGGTFHSVQESDNRYVIEHIIQSLQYLRDRKYGALIAIERGMTNPQARQSGVLIDSVVSEELLSTIFQDKTPLHDGGVIIAKDRIVAAGCLFPVSQRQDLNRTLGLRHRAAIGFAEDSDALVVVLSEETGEVCLCSQNQMERPLEMDQLRQRLTEAMAGAAGTRQVRSLFKKVFKV